MKMVMEERLVTSQNLIRQRKFLTLQKKKPLRNTYLVNLADVKFLTLKEKILPLRRQGLDKQYKYLYSYLELVSLSLKNYPFLPFLIFAGALITTATIGLPVFTS